MSIWDFEISVRPAVPYAGIPEEVCVVGTVRGSLPADWDPNVHITWRRSSLLHEMGPRGLCEFLMVDEWREDSTVGTVTMLSAVVP